jgi:hypothetical protein
MVRVRFAAAYPGRLCTSSKFFRHTPLVGLGCEVNQMEVYGYAEPVSAKGLVFMDTPGYVTVSIFC